MDLKGELIGIIWGSDGKTCEDAAEEVMDAVSEYMKEHQGFWMNELDLLRQENEQLRVDLIIAEEMFDAIPPRKNGVAMINIKRRCNFRHEK